MNQSPRIIDVIQQYENIVDDPLFDSGFFSYDRQVLPLKLQLADLVYDLYIALSEMPEYDIENTLMAQFGFAERSEGDT